MNRTEYKLKDNLKIIKYLTDLGIYIYLTDDDGNQIAEVIPSEYSNFHDLVKGGERGTSE